MADERGNGDASRDDRRREPDHLEVIALEGIPEIRPGDDLAQIIVEALEATPNALPARDDDVLVVTQKVVSKAEGAIADLATIEPRAGGGRVRGAMGSRRRARSSSCCGTRSGSFAWRTGS